MKTTTIDCVSREAYRQHVVSLIAANHQAAKNGARRGGSTNVARLYGIQLQELANYLKGSTNPPRKMLERDGLAAHTVYVKKTNENQ